MAPSRSFYRLSTVSARIKQEIYILEVYINFRTSPLSDIAYKVHSHEIIQRVRQVNSNDLQVKHVGPS